MATQLDPVTGAPLLTPDLGTIDQLPYKVQPVPLADQTNQPQLGRTYLYPDDVPPVLANLNAMNGTQPDQAQTLHTDGNHALLVASSGGGGGGTAMKPTKVVYANDRALNAINGDPMLGFDSQLDYNLKVLQYSGQLSMTESDYTLQSSDDAALGIMDTNSGLVLWILNFPFYMQPGTSPIFGMFGGYQTLTFPNGLDLTGFFAPSAVLHACVGGSNQHMYGSAIVWQG